MPPQPPGAQHCEIALIGAGVVGLSIALHLAEAGHEVVLVSPPDTGDGASYGNAGVIADYGVLPVGTPEVLRDLPRLLFDRSSPLAIRHAAIASLAPWLFRFALQSLPGPSRRNARALASLLAQAAEAWRDMAAAIDGADLIRSRGVLHGYETTRALRLARADMAARQDLGVAAEFVSAEALGQLEPGLPAGRFAGAVFFPHAQALADPPAMMRRLARRAEAAVAARIHARATAIDCDPGGATLTLGNGGRLRAARVVIAAGAHSRNLARAAGSRVPLDTERGYHLEFDMDVAPVSRPVTPVARGFYFSPMAGRLRVAGTVELGGLDAPASPHRLAALERGARAIWPDLPAPDRGWMGCRPSLPDSLPVIGPARGSDRVILAFGHGHLGLTLAPVTARIVAAMLRGTRAGIDPAPFAPSRF